MRDDEGCTSVFVASTQEGKGYALRAFLIEGRGGLVEQQQGFGQREGGSEKQTLALATGELRGRQGEQRGIQPQGSQGERSLKSTVHREGVCEGNECSAVLGGRLEFLGDISRLAPYLMDMCSVQREPADLYGARREGHKTEDGTQQRCLTATALT